MMKINHAIEDDLKANKIKLVQRTHYFIARTFKSQVPSEWSVHSKDAWKPLISYNFFWALKKSYLK